jgi:hypothetical protein
LALSRLGTRLASLELPVTSGYRTCAAVNLAWKRAVSVRTGPTAKKSTVCAAAKQVRGASFED